MAEPSSSPERPKRDIPWVWVGVGLVMVAGVVRQMMQEPPPHPMIGQTPRADLSLPLADDSGDRLRFEDLEGQVVLVEFWASWCKACRASTPTLNALAERYGDQGLTVLGINVDAEDAALAAAGHRSFGATYKTTYDPMKHAQAVFGVDALPTLVLIDRDGEVKWVEVGAPNERSWAKYVSGLL